MEQNKKSRFGTGALVGAAVALGGRRFIQASRTVGKLRQSARWASRQKTLAGKVRRFRRHSALQFGPSRSYRFNKRQGRKILSDIRRGKLT